MISQFKFTAHRKPWCVWVHVHSYPLNCCSYLSKSVRLLSNWPVIWTTFTAASTTVRHWQPVILTIISFIPISKAIGQIARTNENKKSRLSLDQWYELTIAAKTSIRHHVWPIWTATKPTEKNWFAFWLLFIRCYRWRDILIYWNGV